GSRPVRRRQPGPAAHPRAHARLDVAARTPARPAAADDGRRRDLRPAPARDGPRTGGRQPAPPAGNDRHDQHPAPAVSGHGDPARSRPGSGEPAGPGHRPGPPPGGGGPPGPGPRPGSQGRERVAVPAIDTLEAIRAGGTTQWIRVRGTDAANPVLLLIQQGPGLPMINEARRFGHVLGLEQAFTVIYWDQRGCGRSLRRRTDRASINLEAMAGDTVSLLDYL